MAISPYAGISGLTTTSTDSSKKNKDPSALGQEQFLQLMTTQLNHQDPFKPMDNGQFLGQIAQFGTVNGINELLKSFDTFSGNIQSGQALQASNLIGRDVLANTNQGWLDAGGSVTGAVNLDTSVNNMSVNIYSSNGDLVNKVDLGPQAAGLVGFNWNGNNLDGQAMPAGRYRFEVEVNQAGKTQTLDPSMAARVSSLSLGTAGSPMQVELEHLGQFAFSDIKQIL